VTEKPTLTITTDEVRAAIAPLQALAERITAFEDARRAYVDSCIENNPDAEGELLDEYSGYVEELWPKIMDDATAADVALYGDIQELIRDERDSQGEFGLMLRLLWDMAHGEEFSAALVKHQDEQKAQRRREQAEARKRRKAAA
jgi:hypothetical protein